MHLLERHTYPLFKKELKGLFNEVGNLLQKLFWHLATETKSTLKGASRTFMSPQEAKGSEKASVTFNFLDEENALIYSSSLVAQCWSYINSSYANIGGHAAGNANALIGRTVSYIMLCIYLKKYYILCHLFLIFHVICPETPIKC